MILKLFALIGIITTVLVVYGIAYHYYLKLVTKSDKDEVLNPYDN